MLVLLLIATVSRLSENHQYFAKITKHTKTVLGSSFFDFTKHQENMPRVHSLGWEIQNWSLF